jgi:HAD superfamily hydrolase (TIGR01509 family)
MSSADTTIIFDLGNVILPFDPYMPCAILGERIGKSMTEVAHLIYHNNLERKFEQGLIDGDRFTELVSDVLGIKLTTSEFHDLWADIFTENRDVSDLIRRLKPHHPLILLSNTNVWHWQFALKKFPILMEFKKCVLSYEVGQLKPHPEIYRAALEQAGAVERVVFIDDMLVNIDAARTFGIRGIVFQSAEQLKRELLTLGCRM